MIKISILAITLGIAVMILSVAVVNGFQKEIRNKVSGFNSHFQITAYSSQTTFDEQPIEIYQDFYPFLDTLKNIEHIQVYAYKAAIIKTKDEIYGIVAKGIGWDFDWSFFEKSLIEGHVFKADTTNPSEEVLISEIMAKKLRLRSGDNVYLYFVQNDGSLRPKNFKVAGIYNTGLEYYDKAIVPIDISHIQKRNNWQHSQVGGFEVRVSDFDKIDEIFDEINEYIPFDLNVKSVKELNPEIFNWLELIDVNVVIIIILMIVVAAINIVSALFILILEKINFIGVMKALGADNVLIRKMFLYQASYLILKGMVYGNLIGLSIAFMQKKYNLITLPQESYYVDHVPIAISLWQILLINASTFVVCYIVLILPSWIVARISPVKSIRFN